MNEKLILEMIRLKVTKEDLIRLIQTTRPTFKVKLEQEKFTQDDMKKIYDYLKSKGSDVTFEQLWYN